LAKGGRERSFVEPQEPASYLAELSLQCPDLILQKVKLQLALVGLRRAACAKRGLLFEPVDAQLDCIEALFERADAPLKIERILRRRSEFSRVRFGPAAIYVA
jgi:hypothetical protein